MKIRKRDPIVPPGQRNTDETREPTGEDLKYNEASDSFELDVEPQEGDDYQHDDPYQTAAPHGEDDNSSWDEANPEANEEYRDKPSDVDGQLDGLDIVDDRALRLDETDELLARTPEDRRGDLDEEGYPLRDDAGGPGNPITGPIDQPGKQDPDPEVPPFEDPRRDDNEAEDIPPPDELDEDPFDAPEREEDLFTKDNTKRK
ncbi:hypothetical protein [Parapedobacter lycopersici]|uniref:hypothetical protein n=1 Tax=Parapedobacter lycopersici TaxID=1864939 RepID=UPI00214DD26D|nr:hypothetical protein [Parapedobacter lycopersici]